MSIGASVITLISVGPMGVEDYYPISLISGVYMILSNALATCLHKKLPNTISFPEGASMYGEQILEYNIYMILSKALLACLHKVLPNTISFPQGASV